MNGLVEFMKAAVWHNRSSDDWSASTRNCVRFIRALRYY